MEMLLNSERVGYYFYVLRCARKIINGYPVKIILS